MQRLDTFADWGQSGWDRFFTQKKEHWRDKDYRYLDDIFDLHVLEGSLLDIGCALGDGLIYLKKKCPKVDRFIGADFSHTAIETCRNNVEIKNMEFFQHDILKSLPAKYDNVICLQTLEHLKNPQIAIQNLIDTTKKVLIVGVPYLNRRPDETHLWSFDETDFSDLTNQFCFDKRQRNIYGIMFFIWDNYDGRGRDITRRGGRK